MRASICRVAHSLRFTGIEGQLYPNSEPRTALCFIVPAQWRSSTLSHPFPSRRPPRPPASASRRPSPPSCLPPRLASPPPARFSPSRPSRTKRLARFRCVPPHPPRPETGGVDLSASRIGTACRTSPSNVYLRVRLFSSRASPLRRVVGRRRDTSRRKTETLKPFFLAARGQFFPHSVADLSPASHPFRCSPATSASTTR